MTTAPAAEGGTFTGTLCQIDHTGDTKLMWDHRRPDEVDAARVTFNSLKKKGYVAYKVKSDGSAGEAISEFDPAAEKIIMAPAVVGG